MGDGAELTERTGTREVTKEGGGGPMEQLGTMITWNCSDQQSTQGEVRIRILKCNTSWKDRIHSYWTVKREKKTDVLAIDKMNNNTIVGTFTLSLLLTPYVFCQHFQPPTLILESAKNDGGNGG